MTTSYQAFNPPPCCTLVKKTTLSVDEVLRHLDPFLARENADPKSQVDGRSIRNQTVAQIADSLRTDWMPHAGNECLQKSFVQVEAKVEVHLNPCFLGERLEQGLRCVVSKMLLRYSEALGCVLLSYHELRPHTTHGFINAEYPYVHFILFFKGIALALKNECWLLARLKQSLKKADGLMTVLGVFHSSGNLPSGWKLDRGTLKDKNGESVSEDRLVWFQLQGLTSHDPVSLVGAIPDDCFADNGSPVKKKKDKSKRSGDTQEPSSSSSSKKVKLEPQNPEGTVLGEKQDPSPAKQKKDKSKRSDGTPERPSSSASKVKVEIQSSGEHGANRSDTGRKKSDEDIIIPEVSKKAKKEKKVKKEID